MTISQAQNDPGILQTVSLLTSYCFDLRGAAPVPVINGWLKKFSALWIRLAVIEALYLGRYKAVSVEHLLEYWSKKGQPNFHFSAEFERMVSQNLPRSLANVRDQSMEELTKKSDQELGGEVPQIVPKLPEKKLTNSDKEDLLILRKGFDHQRSQEKTAHGRTHTSRSPLTAPSIEQFIPIATESDLLSRLQSVLTQETENV